jgi:hypothetical protein
MRPGWLRCKVCASPLAYGTKLKLLALSKVLSRGRRRTITDDGQEPTSNALYPQLERRHQVSSTTVLRVSPTPHIHIPVQDHPPQLIRLHGQHHSAVSSSTYLIDNHTHHGTYTSIPSSSRYPRPSASPTSLRYTLHLDYLRAAFLRRISRGFLRRHLLGFYVDDTPRHCIRHRVLLCLGYPQDTGRRLLRLQ